MYFWSKILIIMKNIKNYQNFENFGQIFFLMKKSIFLWKFFHVKKSIFEIFFLEIQTQSTTLSSKMVLLSIFDQWLRISQN